MSGNRFPGLLLLRTPLFVAALVLLLLNDFYLKQVFPGFVTGKLSDITGLFVFTLFWMGLFPKHPRIILTAVALAFAAWKSPYSQPLINAWNNFSPLPVYRVADPSDLLALAVLPPAWLLFRRREQLYTLQLHPVLPLTVAMFAFCATSYRRNFDTQQTYTFNYPPQELIHRINILDTLPDNLPYSFHSENANYSQPMGEDTALFHISGYRSYDDTIFYASGQKIDTIFHYDIPVKDSAYIGSSGRLEYRIHPADPTGKMQEGNIRCGSLRMDLRLGRSAAGTILTITSVDFSDCTGMKNVAPNEKEKKLLLKMAETYFIQPLRPIPAK